MAKAIPTTPPPAPVAPPTPAPAPAPVEAPAKTKAVAKVKPASTALALLARVDELSGFGLQEARVEDHALPFLIMLQAQSPQVTTYKAKGAAAGDLFNMATTELWDGAAGAEIIPCYYAPRYIEWIPKSAGGGFVAIHKADSPKVAQAVRKGSRDVLPNGNELQNTAQWVCLINGEQGWQPVMLSLKSTQFKKSKRLLSTIKGQRVEGSQGMVEPPPFWFVYRVSAKSETNDKGTWFGYEFECTGKLTGNEQGLLEQAYALASSFASGEIKVAAPVDDAPSGAPGTKAGFTEDQSKAADDTI